MRINKALLFAVVAVAVIFAGLFALNSFKGVNEYLPPGIEAAPTAAPLAVTATPEPTPTQAPTATQAVTVFDGDRSYQDVLTQVAFGPRVPGSEAHASLIEWAGSEFENAGWEVSSQRTSLMEQPITNIIAKRGTGTPWIILGAHYDSRLWADRDPDPANQRLPVPGANDGASGVAVLLELARVLPEDLDAQVWLVLFDQEDNGNIPGYDWILGSTAFVQDLQGKPDAAVIVDMIGDADLAIYKEMNSTPELTDEIWQIAQQLGYEERFIPEPRHSMLDDHTPFLRAGIPAVDIIDFDYPAWHTVSDAPDQVSPGSLKTVGDVLLAWLVGK